MSELKKGNQQQYFLALATFLVLLIPWGYYDENLYRYSFVYKKVALIFLGLAVLWSINVNKEVKKIITPFGVGCLAFILSYLLYGNIEKHFILQVIYLEIARQIFMMSADVKVFLRRVNPLILYMLVLKGFFWANGNYIHGGYFSSNLYSFLLLLFCLPEIKTKRYYNLIIPMYYLIISGSKSVYLGMLLIGLYGILMAISKGLKTQYFLNFKKLNIFYSMGGALLFAFSLATVLNSGLLFPQVYQQLQNEKKNITIKNLKRRGLVATSILEVKSDYESKQKALLTEYPVSPYQTTLVLRAVQYDTFFNFENFLRVSIVGDFKYILERAYGFNPHNALVDIFSRLGVAFCFLLAFLYRETFLKIKSPLFLAATFPALCLQPYGFTLGHGLIFCSLAAFIVSDEGTVKG